MALSLFGTNSTYSAFFFLHAYYYTKQSEITLNHHFLYPNWFLCQFRGLFRSHSIAAKGQLLRHCESHHLVFHIFLSILSSASVNLSQNLSHHQMSLSRLLEEHGRPKNEAESSWSTISLIERCKIIWIGNPFQ